MGRSNGLIDHKSGTGRWESGLAWSPTPARYNPDQSHGRPDVAPDSVAAGIGAFDGLARFAGSACPPHIAAAAA